jgi:hypothetical protein
VLEGELKRRGIDDIAEYQNQVEQENVAHQVHQAERIAKKEQSICIYSRIGYGLCLMLFLLGAARYFIEGNEKDGIGIMITCAILIPGFWLLSLLKRLIWRFMLRP